MQLLLAVPVEVITLGVATLIIFLFLFAIYGFIFFKCLYISSPESVLIRCGKGGTIVRFEGATIAFPFIHQIHRLYAGVIQLKHPTTGNDWPVQLVPDAEHATRALRAFSNQSPHDTRATLQSIIDKEAANPEKLLHLLNEVGYAPLPHRNLPSSELR